jgi:hypothetical protein
MHAFPIAVLNLGLLAVSAAGQAQNLLVNPNFDADIAGWTSVPLPLPGHVAHDPSEGSSRDGSLRVAIAARAAERPEPQPPVPNPRVQQCVPVTPGAAYDVGVRCRAALAQPPYDSYCHVRLAWFSDEACGTPVGDPHASPVLTNESDYHGTGLDGVVAPANAVRALVALDSGTGTAHFDSAFLRRHSAKGDFDGNGQVDLVLAHAAGALALWSMNGTVRTSVATITPAPASSAWQVVASDDFDRDGHSDLVLWNDASGATEFWRMNGGTRQGEPVALQGAPALPLAWRPAASADFNADGHPDLLWRNTVTEQLSIWRLDGMAKVGEITPSPAQAVDANWRVVAALDIDSSGGVDLVWYNVDSGRVVVWLMDLAMVRVAGRFTTPPAAGDANWAVLAAGDYGRGSDGFPGTPDLLWRNATSGRLVVWHMDDTSRTSGLFLDPSQPDVDPQGWTVVAPR